MFLLTSIPGQHRKDDYENAYGHIRVARLLSKHLAPINLAIPIVCQSSSLGNFGKKATHWLNGQFARSFGRSVQRSRSMNGSDIYVIYPSHQNVADSHDGLDGGDCLPYTSNFHRKQRWLTGLLYQWHADCRFRSKALPHCKTYGRWSDKKLYWHILTSANLSIAAWGFESKGMLRLTNYEAGVLFLPKFVTKTTYFSMDVANNKTPLFPALYDIPLTKYAAGDEPFLIDKVNQEQNEENADDKEKQQEKRNP